MKAYLQEIAYYLPIQIINNKDINEKHPEWSIEKIALKTGIVNRHIAARDETSLTMAEKACNILFETSIYKKEDIDYVILCTQSPDYFLPTSACILQDKLQLSNNCGALDINLGCSGFVYGLGLAKGLIASEQATNVLLVTSETYSKFIHENDKSNKTIFGDAAAATIISSETMKGTLNAEILKFNYGTDGSGSDYLIVKNGAIKNPNNKMADDEFDEEGNFLKNDDFLFMNGKEIFNFTAKAVPILLDENLQKNNYSLDDIDLFIFHQANEFMLNFIRNKCKIPKEKFFVDIKNFGNTVSSTIPIALKSALDSGALQNKKILNLCGFGVGLSSGSVCLKIV